MRILPFWNETDVDAEQTFVQMGDTELPDDDPVQCGSEFCVICNELATEQQHSPPPTTFWPNIYCGQGLDGSRCHLVWRQVSTQATLLDGKPAPQ